MHYLRIFTQIFVAATVIGSAINTQGMQLLDRTVAVVGDEVILSSELEDRLTHLSSKQPNIAVSDESRRKVLDQLIIERLQLRIARRANIKIPDADIINRINGVKARAQAEGISFDEYLARQNLTEKKLRDSITESLVLERVQKGNVNSRIRVTDREVNEYLSSSAGQDWLKVRFRLSHILLPFEGNDDSASIKKAQEIIDLVKERKESFASLAAKYSKGPNASKGGDLDWRAKEQLPTMFVEQVNNLKPNQLTKPFRSNAGIHILQLRQRSGAEPVMVKRFKTRHILIKTSVLFTDKEAKAKADKIYQELIDGADFIELARKHSEDISNKQVGGDLDWSHPGQFVPAFEKTMQSTPIGEISKPFRSQFGWHILKVDDSRVEDMFDVVKRNQVVDILRQRRSQDELRLWIEELRENAYIEVLI